MTLAAKDTLHAECYAPVTMKFHRKNFTLLISQGRLANHEQPHKDCGGNRIFSALSCESLRKRNNLTLEDLSVRCVQIDR